MANEPLATYLRMYRRRAGLSQEDLAFLIGGMCGSSIARHEMGKRLPVLKSALLYEIVLGVPPRDLFEGCFLDLQIIVTKRAKGMLASLERKERKTKRDDRQITLLKRVIAEHEVKKAA